MAKREIHVWRSRNHGRRRKLSRKYRFGRQDWVIAAALAIGTILPIIIWSMRPPSATHATTEHAVITDAGSLALGTYNESPIEMAIVSDRSTRILRVRFFDREGKPPPQVSSVTFQPRRGFSDSIPFEQRAVGLVSTAPVDALRPGAVLTITGKHHHRVILVERPERMRR